MSVEGFHDFGSFVAEVEAKVKDSKSEGNGMPSLCSYVFLDKNFQRGMWHVYLACKTPAAGSKTNENVSQLPFCGCEPPNANFQSRNEELMKSKWIDGALVAQCLVSFKETYHPPPTEHLRVRIVQVPSNGFQTRGLLVEPQLKDPRTFKNKRKNVRRIGLVGFTQFTRDTNQKLLWFALDWISVANISKDWVFTTPSQIETRL